MDELYDILANYILSRGYIPQGTQIAKQYLLDTAQNTLGIVIYGGASDMPNISGGYPYHTVSVHLQYNASTLRQDAIKFIPVMEQLIKDLEREFIAGMRIQVVSIQHQGLLCNPIGVNDHGISQLVSNIVCKYAEIGG